MERISKAVLDASSERVQFLPDSGITLAFSKHDDTPCATQLIALIERALVMADELEFGIVGIDLSTALERLKAVTEATCHHG